MNTGKNMTSLVKVKMDNMSIFGQQTQVLKKLLPTTNPSSQGLQCNLNLKLLVWSDHHK